MQKTFQDLTGQKFGKLTVISFSHRENNRTYWKCKCDCGSIKIYRADFLKRSIAPSCGCSRKEKTRIICRELGYSRKTHGLCNTRLYKIYHNMKDRCYRKSCKAYKDYGGRGIFICKEWLENFKMFYEWAINNGYEDNLTIDRKDNNLGYSPDNCRWITQKEQCLNRRCNKLINYNNKTQTLKEWADELGLSYIKVWKRIHRGWNFERAIKE